MTTLHALRRTYALSFSELAVLTAIPVRSLAAFEYEGYPLTGDERRTLASFFGITEPSLESGVTSRLATQPTPTITQARALALIVATVALSWSMRIGRPAAALPTTHAAAPLMALSPRHAPATNPTTTPTPQPTATATPDPTTTSTPEPTATMIATPTVEPTTTPIPTATPVEPTATARPLRSGRLRKPQPTVAVQTQAVQAQTRQLQGLADHGGAPHLCPIVPQQGRPAITQGYATGSHAPADQWGALDLGVAGGPTAGTPIAATHAGIVSIALNSWPGGNYVSISGEADWRTAYAHLQTVLVTSGQYVEAGTIIGTVGSTGQTSGPHLHYETWFNGVNVDPSPVLNCR